MLCLGIDQHSKQITVCVRRQDGEVILRRQVSTRPEKIQEFFEQLTKIDAEFMAIVEVCGFNDWLIDVLRKWKCAEIVLVQPDQRSNRKTDPRDANQLCETLWLNCERLRHGQRPNGMRRVYIPSAEEQASRQLTMTRKALTGLRTRTLNRIHRILHRHNLMWDYPTKTFQTQAGRAWLAQLKLPTIDRCEMDLLLQQWKLWNEQIETLDRMIVDRAQQKEPGQIVSDAELLCFIPGVSHYSGLAIASRVSPIGRFPHPRSLANFLGITPGSRSSGNAQHRLGAITKQGSTVVRYHLGQVVLHILKKDKRIRDWYRKIRSRRGSKIARVAVMRRISTVIWHILTHREPYSCGGPPVRLSHRMDQGEPSRPESFREPQCAPIARTSSPREEGMGRLQK